MTLDEYLEIRYAFLLERLQISQAINADSYSEVCALKEIEKVKKVKDNPGKYMMTCTGQVRRKTNRKRNSIKFRG